MPFFKVFRYNSTKGMNPRSADYEADALTTTPSRRCPSCLVSLPDSVRVFQQNAGGLWARSTELLHFLLSHPIALSVSRNPILTHFPLSRFLDSLLCVLIALTPGLAFSLAMPRTLSASSFSSGRAYVSLNFLPPSIPFCRIKRHSKAWWSAEVEGAVSERRKAFVAAQRSDEDRQGYISASWHVSSVIVKAKSEAWQTTCYSLFT